MIINRLEIRSLTSLEHGVTIYTLYFVFFRDYNKALFQIFLPKSPNWLQSKGKPYEKAFKKLTGINIDSVCDENNISPESQDLTSLVKKESYENQARESFFIA